MQIVTWVSATSRHLAPNHDDHGDEKQGNGSSPDSYPIKFSSKQFLEDLKHMEENREETKAYEGEKKIGSRPPNCENKCYGCIPCEAIQSPTITRHLDLEYANYLPEGWKCKCGPSVYSP
ncbi:hypothetical protein Nepgr_005608 [Nepenthes gracilis]|uniref:Epidermal patterning factor-like protein n=1 Tax=Nepenthes gracilis TaxID=150966 RepID=A0AAD3S3I6_NEPGR|nr:hypothetical protein Nepgr_005608 [Nepenthes gracilis]